MRSFKALLLAELVTVLRDKATLVFTFIFPVLFILIFGFLMGGDTGERTAHIGLVISAGASSDSLEQVIADVGTLDVTHYADQALLEDAMGDQKVDFGLLWDGNRLTFIYDPGRVQDNYTFQELAQGIGAAFSLRYQGVSSVLNIDRIHVGKAAATDWFNLVVPGILAFSILSAGLFAISGHLTAMKERKLLDRLVVTPMRPVMLLAAIASIRLAIVYISTLLTLFIAIAVLHLTFPVNWLLYTVFVAAAAFGSMGFGTAIALLVRRPSSASSIANILSMVMMFLAGIYFPMEIMPSYMRMISKGLPLTYMAEAMRFATGVTDMSLARFWAITAGLVVSGLVLFPFLARYVVRADRN